MIVFNSNIKAIRAIRDVQKDSLTDDYNVGLFNGLELALSILEKREPRLECTVGEPKVFEGDSEEAKAEGRTMCGNKKRSIKNV